MAFWNSSQITNVNTSTPDSGTGDDIRDAFIKVNNNFANVSIQLSQTSQDWLNANVEYNTNLNYATIANLFVANATGTDATLTGNIVADTVTANSELTSLGTANFQDVSITGNIVPTVAGQYNLGSAAFPFANLYVQTTVSTTQVTNSTSAGLFLIHANATVADTQDVGIFANIAGGFGGTNTYAYFGHQYSTNNFVYKITNTDATRGNNIVYDGIYGGAQLGGLFLSNTTVSSNTTTGALRVAGGTGIAGDLNVGGGLAVGGTATVGGATVLTTNTPGLTNYAGSTITSLVITGTTPSTSTGTGALVLSFGGLGVAGNVNLGGSITAGGNISAANLIGPWVGTVQTPSQPNITSVGTLTSLQVGTSIGTPSITISGSGVTGAPLIVSAGGANISGAINNTGTVTSTNGLFDGSNRVLATTNGAGNLTISGNAVTLTATGPGASTVGSNVAIPVVTVDAYGRVVALTSTAISTTLNFSGNTGASNVSLISQTLSITGGTDITTSASGASIIINDTSTLATVTGRGATTTVALTLANVTVGNIVPAANVTQNIGTSTSWFNNIYGTAVHAQYADLAENYLADAEYEPGTVVVFGGDEEITVTTEFADTRVAGAISTDPAYLMNGACGGLPLALRGRIPLKVFGPVTKGDLLVTSSESGCAASVGNDKAQGPAVFAKALETDLSDGVKIIEAVIL